MTKSAHACNLIKQCPTTDTKQQSTHLLRFKERASHCAYYLTPSGIFLEPGSVYYNEITT